MAYGGGKYGDACADAYLKTGGKAVILIVVEGDRGSGFSIQTQGDIALNLPGLLRKLARDIEADLAG